MPFHIILLAEAILCHGGSMELVHIMNRVGANAALEIVRNVVNGQFLFFQSVASILDG